MLIIDYKDVARGGGGKDPKQTKKIRKHEKKNYKRFKTLIKNDVKTHKRALKSKISLKLRPRPLSSPLVSYKTPPYFSNSGKSAPI